MFCVICYPVISFCPTFVYLHLLRILQVNWMPMPEMSYLQGCPSGLEYLTQINQLLVHQQIELLECTFYTSNRSGFLCRMIFYKFLEVYLFHTCLYALINVVVTGFETENKYRICNTLGQQVYFAKEGKSVITDNITRMNPCTLAENPCILCIYRVSFLSASILWTRSWVLHVH